MANKLCIVAVNIERSPAILRQLKFKFENFDMNERVVKGNFKMTVR